jgi:hypothetical protein
MRGGIFFTLACATVFQFTFIEPVNAQSLSTYHLAVNTYFSSISALAIAIPQKEEAGDVYSRPGFIYARKADCFNEVTTDSSPTFLPRSEILTSSNSSAQIAGELPTIAKAAADAGASISSTVIVSYGESGKARWNQLTERSLREALANPNNNDCRNKILQQLRSPPNNISSVPWIIQSVWYATVNLSYRTTSAVDASAKAEIDKKLGQLKANGSVSTELTSDSLVIVSTGKVAFPVAWRPAFISSEHYQYINELMNEKWFDYILKYFDLKKSDQEVLEILQKDFNLDPKKVPHPKDIVEGMSRGKPIRFEQDNEKHLAYLRGVNALFGLAQAIYNRGI